MKKYSYKSGERWGVVKNNIIQTIRDKEMDRKEFLKYSGIALLSLVGLRGLAALLSMPDNSQSSSIARDDKSHGFGSGKYGA